MIPTNLIESALSFTGTPMSKMENTHNEYQFFFEPRFFFAYLLSPEFIEALTIKDCTVPHDGYRFITLREYGRAIYEYQKKNPEPLISLLEKI